MSAMSTEPKPGGPAGLFAAEDLPEQAAPPGEGSGGGAPRVQRAQRDQLGWQAVDLDSLLAADHPVRAVWSFVEALDLAPLYARIGSRVGHVGAPAIDPAILVGLWLWATIDGVGSAREVDRLCTRDHAYRWLCGGVGVNYHTLADFRTAQADWLDAQLTRSIAALLERKLVTLNVVAQDGMRVRAAAKAASFRRRHRLEMLQAEAKAQIEALKAELEADTCASTRRKQAARERAAREREQRLAEALATMQAIEKRQPAKKPAPPPDDGAEPPGDAAGGSGERKKEPRVSTTDPEARVMKMADGGFRPAFNAQLVVDAATQLIVAVDVNNQGSDMGLMAPMHAALGQRYQRTPRHWLADGGFTKLEDIEQLAARGTQPLVPPPASRRQGVDPCAKRATDSPALARWRDAIASAAGQVLYRLRGASVECANAQLRRRDLVQFTLRGLHKARAVARWHALAHNLMRMRSLGFAFA